MKTAQLRPSHSTHPKKITDRALVRKLGATVLIKLALLFGLWWAFVREERVAVDQEIMARQAMPSNVEKNFSNNPTGAQPPIEEGEKSNHGH